jgi:DNA (cytosine-5)-methyltransferase 1
LHYGLVYSGKDEGLRHLLAGIEQINRETGTDYRVTWRMLNSAHYGVPQIRERVFLIGSRNGVAFQFPAPTHAYVDDIELIGTREPFRTAWDAIGDLPRIPNEPSLKVGGKWGDVLPTIPEGQNYLWHTNRGGGAQLFGWRTRYWSFLLKLAKNQPSWTIQAQPGSAIGPFHWCNRKLSIQEMCRIQTFPDGLVFECGRTDVQRMLGNAVPSLMAEVLAREIRRLLLNDRRGTSGLTLLPPVRTPVPRQEALKSLPAKYRSLISDHPDHPGEGRFSAKRRRGSRDQSDPLPLLAALRASAAE